MILSHIVAVSKNGVIGDKNTMPWCVEGELDRFVRLTMGKTVIVGKQTYLSLPKALKGRDVIVLSKTLANQKDVRIASDLKTALKMAKDKSEIFIIGGGMLYDETIDDIDKIYYTALMFNVKGDTYYPNEKLSNFKCVFEQERQTNHRYVYKTYIKKESV